MNVRLVYVSADHKGMIAFGKTLGKFHTQPVSFFRGNLAGAEGLSHMIGNHIIRTAHSSGSGMILVVAIGQTSFPKRKRSAVADRILLTFLTSDNIAV